MARMIGVNEIRKAIEALRSGETTIAHVESLVREGLAAGTLSRTHANMALRSAYGADRVESVPLGDLRIDNSSVGPQVGSNGDARSSQQTRVRITGSRGAENSREFTSGKRNPPPADQRQVENPAGTDALWIEPELATGSTIDSDMVGQLLGDRYLLERELGGGGMGIVYLASDQEIAGEFFAIKVLKPEIRAHPEALPLLREEVRTARALRHPNIVGVYSLNSDRRYIYMLMEYLEGKTLDALLDEEFGRGMPFSRAWPLILDMSSALAYAHDHNVIHSDFKPSNVFVTIAGRAKLLDFGVARVARTRNGRFDPSTLGALTLAYASSEMLEGHKPDQRDDVYALACVIYEMLSGKHPYNLCSALEARAARMSIAPISSLSPSQNAALAHALAVEGSNRASTVEALLAGLGTTTPPTAVAGLGSNPTLIRVQRNTTPFADAGRSEPQIHEIQPRLSRPMSIALLLVVSIGLVGGISALLYRARAHANFHAESPLVASTTVALPALPVIAGDKPEAPTMEINQTAQLAPPNTEALVEAAAAPTVPNKEMQSVAQSQPVDSTPVNVPPNAPVMTAAIKEAAVTAIEKSPAQSIRKQNDGSALPQVSKHPLSVVPVAESIDSCPYPVSALKSERTGSVGLLVYISPDGNVLDTRIDESSGSEDLDQAAVQCVREHGVFASKRLSSKAPGYWGHMRFNWSFGG